MITSAARMTSLSGGRMAVEAGAADERDTQCSTGGSPAFIDCTSCGMITTAGWRRSCAVRNAVSITACAASGETIVCT